MTLPGFRPEVGDMFGQKKHGGFLAPGMDFAFGFTGDDYIDRALQNDWLICNAPLSALPAAMPLKIFNCVSPLNRYATSK